MQTSLLVPLVGIYLIILPAQLLAADAKKPRPCNASMEYIYDRCECLQFIIEPQVNWQSARSTCTSRGGQLVTIHNSDKQKYIAGKIPRISAKNGVWIGLSNVQDGKLQWVDGEPEGGYSEWAEGEPDGKFILAQGCVVMHRNERWSWKDFFCSTSYSYICQYELPCGDETGKDPEGFTTTEVVIAVIGGVAGFICFFVVLFLIINRCRSYISRKRRNRHTRHNNQPIPPRQIEFGRRDSASSLPMIPPPEKVTPWEPASNDLGKSSVKRKKSLLSSANVEVAGASAAFPSGRNFTHQESVKLSNVPADGKPNSEASRRNRAGSVEDNEITANTDTGYDKEYVSSVSGVDKL